MAKNNAKRRAVKDDEDAWVEHWAAKLCITPEAFKNWLGGHGRPGKHGRNKRTHGRKVD